MSKRRRDQDYLNDIREAMQRIIIYTKGLTFEEFLVDNKTQDAVVRNLQVIGEAVKKLSDRPKTATVRVPWKEMAGLRDKIVHDYFGINYEIVWTVARQELPVLVDEIDTLLD